MNKRGATLQEVMMGGLVFVIMFVAGLTIFGGFHETYKDTDYYDNNFVRDAKYFNGSGINGTNETYDLVQKITSKLDETSSNQDNLDTSIVGALNAAKLVGNMFDLIKEVINFIAITLQIPNWIIGAILAAILITVTLAIIATVTGRRTE